MRKMHKMLPASLMMLALLIPSTSSAQFRQETLESVRGNIVFPELSPAEKRIVAEQAQIFLRDLYVHRFDKLAFYPGLQDPVPAIQDVIDNIDTLSTPEMEEAIYRIFVEQRDLHLNYIFPPPYANFRTFLPLTFTRTASRRDFFEVRISSVNEALFQQFAPGQRIPEIGDKIIVYDNLPIAQAVERQLATAQGANEFGGFNRAIDQMTFIPHLLHLVPETNTINLVIRPASARGNSGRHDYAINLPWITEFPDAPQTTSLGRASTLSRSARPAVRPQDLEQGVDLFSKMFNEFRADNGLLPQSDYPSNPSNEPRLTWGFIENQHGKFGYLRLTSFVPVTGDDATIEEIRRLVFSEFGGTDGLIFDVRNNGGGSIVLADKLSQLFMRDEAQVIHARLLNTDLNRRIFNETFFGPFSNPLWTQVINDAAGTGNTYSDLSFFTSDADANALGQVYFKPVAVLANARSYSATDLFTCSMKDNGAALVYGEDPRTGAGGANVITHGLFNFALPSVFEALPAGHAMRVSWRQSVRFGPSNGKIIEDFGCEANIDVSQTKDDILNGSEDQINKITRSLKRRARSRRYRAQVLPLQNESNVLLTENNLNYSLFVENTAYIDVMLDGQLVARNPVFVGRQSQLVHISLPSSLTAGSVGQVTLIGRDRRNNRLWNVKRTIGVVSAPVALGPSGIDIDFATASTIAPLVVINQNAPGDGWNLVAPNLQIGYNPAYTDGVDSDAVLPLDLSSVATTQLSFDLEYDTEPDFDFIEVFLTDANGQRVSLLRDSGSQPLQTYRFDVSEFAGNSKVFLHFRFTSDAFITAPGVRLQRITLSE